MGEELQMLDIYLDKANYIQHADWSNFRSARDVAYTMIEKVYHRDLDPRWDRDLIDFTNTYLETPGNTFLLATNGVRISGILAVRRYDGRIKALQDNYDLDTTAELARCFVPELARRQGIAAMLVEESERYCRSRGFTRLYLHTHRFLAGALEFWQAMGFRIKLDANDGLQTVHLEKRIVLSNEPEPQYTMVIEPNKDFLVGGVSQPI